MVEPYVSLQQSQGFILINYLFTRIPHNPQICSYVLRLQFYTLALEISIYGDIFMRGHRPVLPIRLILLLMLIGASIVFVRLRPAMEHVRGYSLRDYVRGYNIISVRLPNTSGATGFISVTEKHALIGPNRASSWPLTEEEFQTLMRIHAEWCQKPSSTFTQSEQTGNYILALRCDTFPHQFELTKSQLPEAIQQLLERVEIP